MLYNYRNEHIPPEERFHNHITQLLKKRELLKEKLLNRFPEVNAFFDNYPVKKIVEHLAESSAVSEILGQCEFYREIIVDYEHVYPLNPLYALGNSKGGLRFWIS